MDLEQILSESQLRMSQLENELRSTQQNLASSQQQVISAVSRVAEMINVAEITPQQTPQQRTDFLNRTLLWVGEHQHRALISMPDLATLLVLLTQSRASLGYRLTTLPSIYEEAKERAERDRGMFYRREVQDAPQKVASWLESHQKAVVPIDREMMQSQSWWPMAVIDILQRPIEMAYYYGKLTEWTPIAHPLRLERTGDPGLFTWSDSLKAIWPHLRPPQNQEPKLGFEAFLTELKAWAESEAERLMPMWMEAIDREKAGSILQSSYQASDCGQCHQCLHLSVQAGMTGDKAYWLPNCAKGWIKGETDLAAIAMALGAEQQTAMIGIGRTHRFCSAFAPLQNCEASSTNSEAALRS